VHISCEMIHQFLWIDRLQKTLQQLHPAALSYSSTPTSISFDKSATVNFFPDEFCVRNSLFLSKYFA